MALPLNDFKYQDFIEQRFTIIDKDKHEVPFIMNPAQLAFMEACTYRNIILKARKLGFSSLLLAIACTKFILGRNERCVSMSFDTTASGKQLERAKHFIHSYEAIRQTKMPLKYNSKSEMVFEGEDDRGRKYINTLRIGTAKSNSFGRGDDITFLHLTETSQCDNLEELLSGVGEALVNGAMTTMETTANGFNSFKRFWDEAVLGLRGYTPMFFSPVWEYSEEFLAQKARELGDLFEQEYPPDPEMAFVASGSTYLDKLAMNQYLREVKTHEPLASLSRV
jgi:hypothetical protein